MGASGHEMISIPATDAELGLDERAIDALAEENAARAVSQATDDWYRNNVIDGTEPMPEARFATHGLRGGHTYAQQWAIHARIGNDPALTRLPYGFRCVRR